MVLSVALVLIGAGGALAASGVGTLATGGEDRAATAQSAQAPVGAVSAGVQTEFTSTTAAPPTSDVQTDVQRGDDSTGTPASGSPDSDSAPAAGGGGAGQLPFTGLLAIAVLVLGAALLLIGYTLRRRTPDAAA